MLKILKLRQGKSWWLETCTLAGDCIGSNPSSLLQVTLAKFLKHSLPQLPHLDNPDYPDDNIWI